MSMKRNRTNAAISRTSTTSVYSASSTGSDKSNPPSSPHNNSSNNNNSNNNNNGINNNSNNNNNNNNNNSSTNQYSSPSPSGSSVNTSPSFNFYSYQQLNSLASPLLLDPRQSFSVLNSHQIFDPSPGANPRGGAGPGGNPGIFLNSSLGGDFYFFKKSLQSLQDEELFVIFSFLRIKDILGKITGVDKRIRRAAGFFLSARYFQLPPISTLTSYLNNSFFANAASINASSSSSSSSASPINTHTTPTSASGPFPSNSPNATAGSGIFNNNTAAPATASAAGAVQTANLFADSTAFPFEIFDFQNNDISKISDKYIICLLRRLSVNMNPSSFGSVANSGSMVSMNSPDSGASGANLKNLTPRAIGSSSSSNLLAMKSPKRPLTSRLLGQINPKSPIQPQVLSLKNCWKLSDPAVELISNFTQLQVLKLQAAWRITDTSMVKCLQVSAAA